jgi:transcriptional regulator with XRE-family HTH domain
MTRPRKDREAHEKRGERAKQIRDALGLSQSDFLPLLNEAARRLGLPAVYAKDYVVSRTETGTRPMTFEDVAVWSLLDKEQRGWEWLALGDVPVATTALFKQITREALRTASAR